MNSIIKLKNKSVIKIYGSNLALNSSRSFPFIQKRFMFNGWKPPSLSSLGNKLFRIKGNTVQKADMGRYSAVKYKPGIVKPDGSPIDKHEETHYNVLDKETGEIIALLTSSKAGGIKLGPVKLDGSYIEHKDAEWNPIPHPEKGGQYLRFLGTIRVVHKDLIKEYPAGTLYLEKHEQRISNALAIENIDNRPRQWRMAQTELIGNQKTNKNTIADDE